MQIHQSVLVSFDLCMVCTCTESQMWSWPMSENVHTHMTHHARGDTYMHHGRSKTLGVFGSGNDPAASVGLVWHHSSYASVQPLLWFFRPPFLPVALNACFYALLWKDCFFVSVHTFFFPKKKTGRWKFYVMIWEQADTVPFISLFVLFRQFWKGDYFVGHITISILWTT